MQTLPDIRRRAVLVLLGLSCLPVAAPAQAGAAPAPPPPPPLALHLLNRLGYGPGPGDVERVRAMGLRAYLDSQLAPPPLPPVLDARLRALSAPDVPAPEARLLRAITSPRQLEEVLGAFWLSWFGVAHEQGADLLRPAVLGRYAALKTAALQSPGMRNRTVPDERAALHALARHFLTAPTPALLRSLARTWSDTGGEQRAVLRTLFTSREFLAPTEYGSKHKDGFRFVVSAVRASGLPVENAAPLAQVLAGPMGADERDAFAGQLAQGRLALAMAPPGPHRYASSAPPMRVTPEGSAGATVARPGPVLMTAPSPTATKMAAASRSEPADPGRLLELLRSEAFVRY